jgi:hypothetical protein
MDWSPLPFIDVSRPDTADASVDSDDGPLPAAFTVITFRDPRFMGTVPLLRNTAHMPPLTATVVLDSAGRVVRQTIDGRTER